MTQIVRIEVPIPYPVKWVNCYYVEDTVPTLIDPGINGEEAFEVLRSALADFGTSVSRIGRIIATHGHLDHAGLAGRIQAESGAEVFIHPRDSFGSGTGPSFRPKEVGECYRLFLLKAGVPEATASGVVESVLHRLKTFLAPVSSESPILEGQEFVFGDCIFEAVHTPGHSPGSVCLFNRADGTLFSGDTLLQEIFHNPASRASYSKEYPEFSPVSDHLASMSRLKSLPVKKVMPGHGAMFSTSDRRIQRILGHHERRGGEILRIVKARCDRRRCEGVTPFDVAGDLFPAMSGMDVFFGVSAVQGHLDFLKDQGLCSAVTHRLQNRYLPRSPMEAPSEPCTPNTDPHSVGESRSSRQ